MTMAFSATQDMQDVVAKCLEKDPTKRPTTVQLLKHRFFKWTRPVKDAIEELLNGVPNPVTRLSSLTRRSKETLENGEEYNPMAADEQISLGALKVEAAPVLSEYLEERNCKVQFSFRVCQDGALRSLIKVDVQIKDALHATQRFDADSALVLLHRMLQSTGVIINANGSSPEAINSALPHTPKSNSSTPRKASFTKRKNSFARGNQWPNLPPSALKHCSVRSPLLVHRRAADTACAYVENLQAMGTPSTHTTCKAYLGQTRTFLGGSRDWLPSDRRQAPVQ